MKKFSTTIVLCFLAITIVNAQTLTIPRVKYPYSIYKKTHDPAAQQSLISVLVKGDVDRIAGEVARLGGFYKFAAGDIACVRIPAGKINELAAKNFVQRIEGSDAKMEVLNDQMLLNNNVYLVHQGFNLPKGYTGEGVVVGIIDEGLDFTHMDFRDSLGKTRFKWVWDQRLSLNGTYTPQPYGYGQSFTKAQIDNLEAGAVYDHGYSHGTHVTGIAAGNGQAVNNYKGVAPKADIIFVAVSTTTSDNNFLTNLVDAVEYIYNRADSLSKPCVINISLGTYFGSHDGLDLQAQAIDNLITAKNGRALVCAAGNEGAAPIHYRAVMNNDTVFTWLGGYSSTQSLYFQLWADSADIAGLEWMVGVDKIDTVSKQYRGGTSWKPATAHLGYDSASIFAGGNRIGRVESYLYNSFGRYSIECLITPDTTKYLWRFMTRGTGKVDVWSFDFVLGNIPSVSSFPIISKFKYADLNQNIVSSFTCSPKVITVGSYINRTSYTDYTFFVQRDTIHQVGQLSDFSSHGPTRDGRIKPDITATGQWVLSCGAEYDLAAIRNLVPSAVGAGGFHRVNSGTSMASPVVAGIAALYLQKNPTASWLEIKNAILSCTKTDNWTGTSLPDNKWGYGKIDAYRVLKGCAVGMNEEEGLANILFDNYPNPFSDFTTIQYDLTSYGRLSDARIVLTDAVGKQVRDIYVQDTRGTVTINRNELAEGIYLYSLILNGKIVRTNKLVVM